MSTSNHSSGHFLLDIQSDGSLVTYPANNSPDGIDWSYWSYSYVVLIRLGVLFLNTSAYGVRILANSSHPDKYETTIYRATLDADGIFRLYLHHFKSDNSSSMLMEWSNQCEVSDFCGLDSYCSAIGSKAGCNCYPGFDFINTSNKFLGCHRNFNEDDCGRSEDPEMLYNVASLENMWWADRPYSVKPIEDKACGKSCLEDCNCGAVLYTDTSCSKYKLPLRYGRIKNATKPSVAFFKVYHPRQFHEVLIESKKSLILILSIILGSVLCLCLVLATSSILMYRHKFDRYRKLTENVNLGLAEEFTLRLFSYNELERATEGFQEELGRGSYGAVYKGTISEGGKTIVVKRLEKDVEEGTVNFGLKLLQLHELIIKTWFEYLAFVLREIGSF